MPATAELIAKIVTLRNQGKSYFDISMEVGVSENLVARHLKGHPGVTFKQGKGQKPVSAEVIAEMVILRNEGKTYPEIAAKVGLSKFSVSKYVKDHPDVTYGRS